MARLHVFAANAATLILCAWSLSSSAQSALLGASVNESRGTAHYRVPIVVSPGPAGNTPQIALVYSSESVKGPAGWLGVGWSLAGLSAIERDRKHGVPYDYESSACAPELCYRDDFVLDGQDLVCSGASCTGVYRTQSDDGRKITFLGAAQGWEILDREGRRLVYGSQDGTRVANPRNGQVFSWLLERIEDASGNWIQIGYADGTGLKYPSSVTYAQAGEAANRHVIFTYLPRPDLGINYTPGFRQEVDRNLASISVKAGTGSGELVARYDLVYEQETDSGRSLLASVQRVGADGTTTLPPHGFTYAQSAHQWRNIDNAPSADNRTWLYFDVLIAMGGTYRTHRGALELNGDSLIDYVHVAQGYPNPVNGHPEIVLDQTKTYWVRDFVPRRGQPYESPPSTSAPEFEELGSGRLDIREESTYNPSAPIDGSSEGTLSAGVHSLTDIDGDGYTDSVGGSDDCPTEPWPVRRGGPNGIDPTPVPWEVSPYLGADVPVSSTVRYRCGQWIRTARETGELKLRAALLDLTGDGRPDRVLAEAPSLGAPTAWNVAVNRGYDPASGSGSFSTPVSWSEPSGWFIEQAGLSAVLTEALLLDLNGDGLPDRLYDLDPSTSSSNWRVAYNYGGGFDAPEAVPTSFNELRYNDFNIGGTTTDIGDINGDGFPDRLDNLPSITAVWFGTGSGFKATSVGWDLPGGFVNFCTAIRRVAPNPTDAAGADLMDHNGDGLLDRACQSYMLVALNAGPQPGLLESARNPLGGEVHFEYKAAALEIDESDLEANPDLPVPTWVVARLVVSAGRAEAPDVVDELHYAEGSFDREEREFRGFGTVTRSHLGGGGELESEVVSHYRTDDACQGWVEGQDLLSGAGELI